MIRDSFPKGEESSIKCVLEIIFCAQILPAVIKMAWNHIQWQNPPIFRESESSWTTDGKCPGASKSVALWSCWNASHPYRQSLLKKHITDVEDVKEQAPSIRASGQRRAKNKIPDWRHPWGICLPVLCLDFRIDLWFLLIVRNVWNRRSLLCFLLTKWCLSRSGNCICYGIYSISYVLKWRNLCLAQGSLCTLICF